MIICGVKGKRERERDRMKRVKGEREKRNGGRREEKGEGEEEKQFSAHLGIHASN